MLVVQKHAAFRNDVQNSVKKTREVSASAHNGSELKGDFRQELTVRIRAMHGFDGH